MKKITMLVVVCTTMTLGLLAQEGGGRGNWGGGGQRQTVAERVARVHQKFDSTFHFATEKQAKIDSAFAEQYRAQDKMREEMRGSFTPGQQPDPAVMQTMRDKMQELAIARDEKLQGILSETEYKKWKDELEPSMRPQRRGGEGRDGGRGGDAPKQK
jgi:hypothetical protein